MLGVPFILQIEHQIFYMKKYGTLQKNLLSLLI